MATIVIQKGHCYRTKGATGTRDEQKFAEAVGNLVAKGLKDRGHKVHIVLADTPAPYPASDAFIALHCDGSTNPATRGGSVGYPDSNGARLAAAWKRAHQRQGFPGGWHNDNYTTALRSYYGYGRARAKYRFLAEHITATNTGDYNWGWGNLEKCAQAHVDAIGEIFGHPATPAPPQPAPPAPQPQPTPTDDLGDLVANNPVLQQGSTGGHVSIMQALLIAHAKDLAKDVSFVDGNFGPGTANVLRTWQARTGKLAADGVCGPSTWRWLCGT